MKAVCALCASEKHHVLFEGQDWLHGQEVRADVRRCAACGLVYLWPVPEHPQDAYPDDYAPHVGEQESGRIDYSAGYQRGLERKASLVRLAVSGSLLDIGCASGEFLAAMRDLGHSALLGADISASAVRRARQRFGLDVWVGDLPGICLPDGSLDGVTLWHVLEHLPHPRAALRDIARVLKPDGVLVLACPMVDSWEARLFGRYWAGYDVPRHLYAFSRETLPNLLDSLGFEAHEVANVVRGYNSAKISSVFWLRGRGLLLNRPRLLRWVPALMGAAVAVLSALLSRLLGSRQSVAVLVARKRSE